MAPHGRHVVLSLLSSTLLFYSNSFCSMLASVTRPCKGHTDPTNLILTNYPPQDLNNPELSWFLCSKQFNLSQLDSSILPDGLSASRSYEGTDVLCLSPKQKSNRNIVFMEHAVRALANTAGFSRKVVICAPSPVEYFVGFIVFSTKGGLGEGERIVVSGFEREIVTFLQGRVPQARNVNLAVRRIPETSDLGLYVGRNFGTGGGKDCLEFYQAAMKFPLYELTENRFFSVHRGILCYKCCGMVYLHRPTYLHRPVFSPPPVTLPLDLPPSFRNETFDRIIEKLNVEKVCLVCVLYLSLVASAHNEQLSAPPASGKTHFLNSFRLYVNPTRSHQLSITHKRTEPQEIWSPETYFNCTLQQYKELDMALSRTSQDGLDPLWVFIDEAQETYSFEHMWSGFKNAKMLHANVRVMAVGSYGSTRSLFSSPTVALPRENRMHLYGSETSPWPALAFTEKERRAYLKEAGIHYPVELKNHLISFGRGNPAIFIKYLTFVVAKVHLPSPLRLSSY